MNKLLVVTVVVFIIIASIIVSASVISDKGNKDSKNSRPSYTTMADPATKQDFAGLQDKITQNDNEFGLIVKRIDNLEQMSRTLYDQIKELSESTPSSNETNNRGLNCQITGYLNVDNSPISQNEIDPETINEDIAAGRKKMALSCSY